MMSSCTPSHTTACVPTPIQLLLSHTLTRKGRGHPHEEVHGVEGQTLGEVGGAGLDTPGDGWVIPTAGGVAGDGVGGRG